MKSPLFAFSLGLTACLACWGATEREPKITAPPKRLGLSPFYKKHVELGGLPIVGSEKVPDAALRQAHRIAKAMLARLDRTRRMMVRNRTRVAIMAESEVTVDIPEHSDLYRAFPGTDWNKRARGLGATRERPVISAAEENLLGYPSDRYHGESIFVHEFAHAIMDMGLVDTDRTFRPELLRAFENAVRTGLWKDTYALSNPSEYWAETVQSYFDANRTANPPDGVHNHVGTRAELKAYDPMAYRLIRRVFGDDRWNWQVAGQSKSTLNGLNSRLWRQ